VKKNDMSAQNAINPAIPTAIDLKFILFIHDLLRLSRINPDIA
jgi:hypothetical protein